MRKRVKTGFQALVVLGDENNVGHRKLIAAGADPNYTLPSGNKLLLVAMAYRHTAATLALLDRGADITARDRAGNTPLHLAAQVGNVEVVKALLAKGADANARTPRSAMPAGAEAAVRGFRGAERRADAPPIAARGTNSRR